MGKVLTTVATAAAATAAGAVTGDVAGLAALVARTTTAPTAAAVAATTGRKNIRTQKQLLYRLDGEATLQQGMIQCSLVGKVTHGKSEPTYKSGCPNVYVVRSRLEERTV